jgi:acyl-CoA synthetase (AMP-forming)/AMP-acid ligase II
LISGAPGDTVSLAGPGRGTLSFSELRGQIERTGSLLLRHGMGANDCIAVVLPNGPELAVAFLAVSSAAAVAPLNPAYRRPEFQFLLQDLGASALITQAGVSPAAVEAASALGIPCIGLASPPDGAPGVFDLEFPSHTPRPGSRHATPWPGDIALLLHTSGTTSRPKLVPLTHRNLCASAQNVIRALRLTAADRCLNIMPLFHIHGLVAGVLAPLAAGGSVCCTPGFDAHRFFGWLDESHATWYTAVPTMHQAILSRAGRNLAVIQRRPLRFVRSSSSPLSATVWQRLEDVLSAPVINAYGMTEASHQIASIPLPPGESRRGTVGLGMGIEVAIMDENGRPQPPCVPGEVVIRGCTITPGYLHNSGANQTCFRDGWFRTGDQGSLDPDGYLTLTGRLKEMINCGGEKIAPAEVDEVLLEHPAVEAALAFAMPHDKLGETVAAAVVLRPDCTAEPADLRGFASLRLARFKVPRRILIVDEIPQGPTGKLQRIGLAARLGLG